MWTRRFSIRSPSYVCQFRRQLTTQPFCAVSTLDLTGQLPEYKSETHSGRLNREAVVDALLASEEFVDFYTLKLAKLLRVQSKIDKNKVTTTPEAARAFHDWLAKQLACWHGLQRDGPKNNYRYWRLVPVWSGNLFHFG